MPGRCALLVVAIALMGALILSASYHELAIMSQQSDTRSVVREFAVQPQDNDSEEELPPEGDAVLEGLIGEQDQVTASISSSIEDEQNLVNGKKTNTASVDHQAGEPPNESLADEQTKIINGSITELNLPILNPSTLHIFQYGEPRTATTTQFNLACVSLFLHIQSHHPHLVNNTICHHWGEAAKGNLLLQRNDIPQAIKSHTRKLPPGLRNTTILFTTADNRAAGEKKLGQLEKQGYNVGMVQDLQTLSEIGIIGYIDRFVHIFNLTHEHREMMRPYFEDWDTLRQCCGMQMSKYYRNELVPAKYKNKNIMKAHAFCGTVDMNELENRFMNNALYKLIDGYTLMKRINRPSIVDGDLNGSYCSRYNDAVRKHAISNKLNSRYGEVENNFGKETRNPLAGIEHLVKRYLRRYL